MENGHILARHAFLSLLVELRLDLESGASRPCAVQIDQTDSGCLLRTSTAKPHSQLFTIHCGRTGFFLSPDAPSAAPPIKLSVHTWNTAQLMVLSTLWLKWLILSGVTN